MPVPAPTRTLARVLFGLALLGVLVVTHLGLQAQKGFSDGCTGFGDVVITADAVGAAPEEGGCGEVATGEYATFLGVSNIAWGLVFYIVLALMRVSYAYTGDRRLRLASFGWVSVGFAYTLYLVGLQAFVIGSWCILCMISAAIVTTLFVLHILEHRRDMSAERHSAPPPTTKAALVPYGAVSGVFAVLLGVVVVLGSSGEAPAEPAPVVTDATTPEPAPTEATSLAPPLPMGCAYDPVFAPIADLSEFTNNPSQGTGPVTVVEVFDPNCPACQALHGTLTAIKESNLDRATFYSVPFPLRPPAVGQAAALAWARDSGAYFDLVDALFAGLDGSWGMSQDELREAANSVGLDGPSLVATLQDQTTVQPLLDQVQADANAVQTTLSTPSGGMSTPKLVINGRVVANTTESLTERCLNEFIALAAGVAPSGSSAVVEEVQ
ncbi:MAG: vitamin K epoxide reductase family protein [Bacteroidota bacterium]